MRTLTVGDPATLAAARRSYRDEVLADSPLGFWMLDEPSGTTATDLVAGRDATYSNSPTLHTAGPSHRIPHGVTWNGSNQNAATATQAAFNVACSAAWSIEAWVKFTGTGTTIQTFAAWRGTGATNNEETAALCVNNGVAGRIQANVSNAAADARLTIKSDGGWNDGLWHHVVATAVSSGVMTLYVDGVSRDTTAASRISGNGSARRVSAGSNTGTIYSQFLAGSVAAVAVYNTTLTDVRVAAHYQAGR